MKREDKNTIIEQLTERINNASAFYLADISEIDAADTSELRRACHKKQISLIVVKNSLLQKAFERSEKNTEDLPSVLKGNTSLMFCETGNVPAILIKEFRRKHERPILKGAYVEECVYIGDESLDALVNLKSKNELIADIVLLLQSPMNNVMSSLQSGSNIITGVLKTLSEKKEA
jgi:large subunit ribosomal protein L10